MVVTVVPLPLQQNTSTQTHTTIHCHSWSPCANITTGHIPLAFSGMLPRPRPPRPRPLPGGTSVLTQEQGGPAYHGACHKWGHIAAHHIDRVVGDSVHNSDPLSPRWLSHHSLQQPPPEEQPAVAMPTARSAATSSPETTPLCYWSSLCDSPHLISPDHCGASAHTQWVWFGSARNSSHTWQHIELSVCEGNTCYQCRKPLWKSLHNTNR